MTKIINVVRIAQAVALFIVAGVGCAVGQPRVYVGIPPQRWLVQQLTSNREPIGLLLDPGQNPHTFEPTARQVKELSAAQVYLMMGLPFERALVKKVQAVNPSFLVRDMALGVPRRQQLAHAHSCASDHVSDACAEGADPHVWLTPAAMTIMASNTAAALLVLDLAGQGGGEARLAQLCERLVRLDAELQTMLAPVRGGVMLTYHSSWGYFTDAYGLRQVAIEAEGRAPAARQLAALMDLAIKEKVRRVFTEPPYDPKSCNTLARQINAEVVTIDPLAEAWDANLRAIAAQVQAGLQKNTDKVER